MIFLVREPSSLGRPRFAQRLVEHLDLEPLDWPLSETDREVWKTSLAGWWESSDRFFGATNYLCIDRMLGILMLRKAGRYPPPPSGPGVQRVEFEQWRDRFVAQAMVEHMGELLGMLSRMIDRRKHIVLSGEALGTSPRDSPLSLRLQAQYSDRPILRIRLQLPPGAAPGENAPEHEAVLDRRARYSQDELLSLIHRVDGDIELDEAIRSARTRIPEP